MSWFEEWDNFKKNERAYRWTTAFIKSIFWALVIAFVFVGIATALLWLNNGKEEDSFYSFYDGKMVGAGFIFVFGAAACYFGVRNTLKPFSYYYDLHKKTSSFEEFDQEVRDAKYFYTGLAWGISVCYTIATLFYMFADVERWHLGILLISALSPVMMFFLGLFIIGLTTAEVEKTLKRNLLYFIENENRENQN